MENEIMMMLGTLGVLAVLSLINYILVGLALFYIAKEEKYDKPWLAWVPIANCYLLIKFGQGNKWFILAFIGGITGIPVISQICSVVFTAYSLKMYFNLTDMYDASFMFIAIGVLGPLCLVIKPLAGFVIPCLLIGMVGQFKLGKSAKNPSEMSRRIRTSVVKGKK